VRDVLFDELKTRIVQETQVNRAAGERDWQAQEEALPYLIRAVAAGFARDSVITRGLGDQAFLWASALRWDAQTLAERGIRAHTLISSSERSWSFPWKGGFLPPEVLAGPLPGADGAPGWIGRQPLAVLFEGPFPALDPTRPAPDAAPGRLFFSGCSELFQNERLLAPDFRADHLLLNAVAALTLDEPLAAIATRRPVARGFDWVPPERRLLWRGLVLAAFPLALAAAGLLRALGRRGALRI
jgi:hypothetical protein